jgi:PadR family transcriptional regulator PadR
MPVPHTALDSGGRLPYIVGVMGRQEPSGSLGQFEQLVLTAILTLKEDAYGVSIQAKASELAHPKDVSQGAVYVTLDRLEDKGMISSQLSQPTAERGGRAKRCYRLEALGERALQESAATAKRIWDVTSEIWGKDWASEWARPAGKRWRKESV